MGRLGVSLVGGLLGFAIGAPFAAGALGFRIGFTVGSIAANYLFPITGPNTEGPRLTNLDTMTAHEGAPMPITYGAVRIAGVVIWTNGIDETATTSGGGGGGKGSPGGGGGTQTTYTYSASFAVAFCEGPVSGIRRVWGDTKLINDRRDTASLGGSFIERIGELVLASTETAKAYTFYDGSETQEPDPLIQGIKGIANTPAFRNVVYIVFHDLELANFGNRIPSISAEVVKGTVINPPIRIVDWDPQLNVKHLNFQNGLIRVPTFLPGNPDATHGTSVIRSYNLQGELLATDSYVGKNVNNSNNVHTVIITNRPEILYQFQNQASGPGATAWWLWNLGGGSGISIPKGVQPKHSDGSGFNYVSRVVWETVTAPIWFQDYIYALNAGENLGGIARYHAQNIPSKRPDEFFETEQLLASPGRVALAHGGNGLIYAWREVGGDFDDGSTILEFDTHLNLLRSFNLDTGMGSSDGLWVYNDQLVFSDQTHVRLFDISPAAIALGGGSAPVLGTATHLVSGQDAPILHGLSGCLFVKNDGLWSMCAQIELDAPTLQSIVEDICFRCNLTVGQVDATDLGTVTVDGFIIRNPMPGRRAIEGLQPAFNFDGFESDAKVKFLLRGGTSQVTIPADDLGAFTSKPPISELIRSRQQELELPAEVDMIYMDINQDYELGGQRVRKIITTTINKITIELPVVMDSTFAIQAADIYLQTIWTERVSYKFTLTQKYNYLDPADLVTIPIATGDLLVRLTSVTKGKNNLIEFEAVADLSVLYSSNEVGNDPSAEDEQFLGIKGPTKLSVIDIALLRNSDDTPGYYLAAAGYYSGWSGASITRIDDGETVVLVGAIFNESTCGSTNDVLGDPPATTYARDVISKVNVGIISGTLASVSDTDFLNRVNVAVIGNELLLFKDVTQEADGTYTLRHFIRGLQGTTMTGHLISDRFVFLTLTNVKSFDGSLSDTGVVAQFNSTSFGDAGALPIQKVVTLQNGRIKPNPPAHATASKSALTLDYIGQWVRSARLNIEWIDNIDVALDETTEVYEVDILAMDATDEVPATVLRTIAGIGSEKTFTYTSVQQIADFGASPTAVNFEVFQISDRVGRGKVTAFTGGIPGNSWTSYDSLVIADFPIIYAPLNELHQKDGLVAGIDWQQGDQGVQGVNYDFTATSPISGDGARVLEHITGNYNVEVDSQTILNTMLTEFTVEFLFKTDTATSGNWMALVVRLLANNFQAPSSSWAAYFEGNDRDDITFFVNTLNDDDKLVTVGLGLNDDVWHHVACVWNNAIGGTHTQYIYIDGSESATLTITAAEGTATRTSARAAIIGERTDNSSDTQFTGQICRPALYKYALTASQISAHYTETGL